MTALCSVLYCEDIREETGNRKSYMGVHGVRSFISQFPHLFPKFCIVISLASPPENRKSKVAVSVSLADKVLSKVTEEEMEQLFKKGDLGVGNRLATFEVIISPFFVETPGMLKVDVRVDGKPLNLPTLAFLEPGAAASSEFVLSVLPRTKAKRSVAKRTTAKRPTAK